LSALSSPSGLSLWDRLPAATILAGTAAEGGALETGSPMHPSPTACPAGCVLPVALVAALLAAPLLAGCANPPPVGCDAMAWTETRLFFGRSVPGGGEVSESQWRAFLDDTLVPAFKDGFSVLDGTGFWLDSDSGATEQERSKILVVVHPGDAASGSALARVAEAYRRRFEQQAVMRADQPACVGFVTAGG